MHALQSSFIDRDSDKRLYSPLKFSVPGVLIIELHFSHDWCVVPVTEDDERQAVIYVSPQLDYFLWKILFLTVHHQQGPYKHAEAWQLIAITAYTTKPIHLQDKILYTENTPLDEHLPYWLASKHVIGAPNTSTK